MPHDARVPLQADAAVGSLLQRGPFCHVEEATDEELVIGAIFTDKEQRVAVRRDELVDMQEYFVT